MREKLIELLRTKDRCPESVKSCGDCQYHDMAMHGHCDEESATADMLIANGVTIPVRCKDCRWYDAEYKFCDLHSEQPDIDDSGHTVDMGPNDFCSYGERKDNER